MPADFLFDRLEVERFRGIEKAELAIPRGMPTYLIGGNNTGKSTLLESMAFILRGGGFHSYDLTEFDFHRSAAGTVAEDFALTVRLKAAAPEKLPAVQGVGNPIPVHSISVRGRRKKGGLEHRRVLLDEDGDAITYSPRTALKGEVKEKYAGQKVGWVQYYARIDEIRDLMPEVWLLTPYNLERSLYHWQTGPLQKLASILTEKFLDTKWQLTHEGKEREMPATLEKAHAFFREAAARFPFWTDELKPKLERALSGYLGRAATIGLSPDVQTFRDWLAQQLAVSFSAEAGGPMTPLPAMGDGWQALVRLAALEVLQGFQDPKQTPVVILFEEPETYLHPHLRRKLRDVLGRLAAQGWIVICSTHAPEFVSFSSSQQIVRLWRMDAAATPGSLLTASIPAAARFQEKLDERGQHEFLFANRVVLCEGKDDFFAVKTYLQKCDVDLDGLGVTVLDLGGVGSMPAYARMAGSLGIPWCGLTDEDKHPDGTINDRTRDVRTELQAMQKACDMTPFWPCGLENALGMSGSKATPDWQEINLVPKALAQLQNEYPVFCASVEAIRKWIAQ